MTTESPDVVAGMRLLDLAKHHGFQFQRLAPGPDGPLWGVRETEEWKDTIYIGGFWAPDSCSAVRRRKSSLIVPGGLLVAERVCGDALNVLNTVVSYWSPSRWSSATLLAPSDGWPDPARTARSGWS